MGDWTVEDARENVEELRWMLREIVESSGGADGPPIQTGIDATHALEGLDRVDDVLDECERLAKSPPDEPQTDGSIRQRLREEHKGLGEEIDEWREAWGVDSIEEMNELVSDALQDRELWRNAESARAMFEDVLDIEQE